MILILLLRSPKPAPVEVVVPEETTQTVPKQVIPSPIQEQRAQERQITANVQTLAKTFVERYGSFSNEAEFQNLRDLFPLMTDAFVAETENFIATTIIPESFYGVTTRVITVNVDEFDEAAGVAVLNLTTQREEAIDSPQNVSVRYQDIELQFELVLGSWKISSAEWK